MRWILVASTHIGTRDKGRSCRDRLKPEIQPKTVLDIPRLAVGHAPDIQLARDHGLPAQPSIRRNCPELRREPVDDVFRRPLVRHLDLQQLVHSDDGARIDLVGTGPVVLAVSS